jgi:Holliday junction resolvase
MKTHGSAMSSGQPDLIACLGGHFIAIECKQPGNKPTPQQLLRLAEWRRAGAVAFWSDDPDAAMKVLEEAGVFRPGG